MLTFKGVKRLNKLNKLSKLTINKAAKLGFDLDLGEIDVRDEHGDMKNRQTLEITISGDDEHDCWYFVNTDNAGRNPEFVFGGALVHIPRGSLPKKIANEKDLRAQLPKITKVINDASS